jgi:glycosyltransferase involved in cell wall biosynthesis
VASSARGLRVAVVGVSVSTVCGVRDHATLLAEGLGRENVTHSAHWLRRGGGSLHEARSEFRAWTGELASELGGSRPDAVLMHYSVFSYSHRGFPIFVRPVTSTLRDLHIPVVMVLHEFAYSWQLGGWRGKLWALSQRAALIDVMRASAGALVTTDFRAEWLGSRPWLPRRPVVFAPVFSNLPAPQLRRPPDRGVPVVGLFGYAYEGAEAATVLDAVSELAARDVEVNLMLLGTPGRSSSAGEAWMQAARARGIADAVSFSGILSAQDLSDALAACDVLLSPFMSGPSSRKGTLAASLASGRPVIALDGPRGWSELTQSDALTVVAPTPQALAEAIDALLADPQAREEAGARGRAFAEQRMGVARTVEAVRSLLGEIISDRAP